MVSIDRVSRPLCIYKKVVTGLLAKDHVKGLYPLWKKIVCCNNSSDYNYSSRKKFLLLLDFERENKIRQTTV